MDLEGVDRHLDLRICDQSSSRLHEIVQRQRPDLESQQLAADQKHKIDIFEHESVAQELKYAHQDAHCENLYPIAQKDPTAALLVNSLVHDAMEGEQEAEKACKGDETKPQDGAAGAVDRVPAYLARCIVLPAVCQVEDFVSIGILAVVICVC